MNSEELELSLRTEFESYLKGFLADLRNEVSEFQRNFETEFEKHRSQTDEAIRKLVQRFEKDVEFNEAFNESVIEHLRLARDEGATITAVAIGEAEKLRQETAPAAEFDLLRDAVNEISSKTTQSEILKALVESAENFTPRGAFFIVKNDQFVGWRAFGRESEISEDAVQSIKFPVAANTVLAAAVGSLATKASSASDHSEDGLFLEALGFGSPDRMYAIPLIARGRGVAVLYADFGRGGLNVNPDGLETLVRVAGLTVELAAAGVQPSPPPQKAEVPFVPETEPEAVREAEPEVPEPQFAEPEFTSDDHEVSEVDHAFVEPEPAEDARAEYSHEYEAPVEPEVEAEPETLEPQQSEYAEPATEPVEEPEFADASEATTQEFEKHETFVQYTEEVTYFEPIEESSVPEYSVEEPSFDNVAETPAAAEFPEVIEEAVVETEPVDEERPDGAGASLNGAAASQVSEPIAEVASAQAARLRYRDRNIDLPIEVPEEGAKASQRR
ncbi:MAG: hypothetical protein IPM25_11640 [Chloracidobacterium sp.]|nr:hypothetical protein [Chloracidobacterium sp.]